MIDLRSDTVTKPTPEMRSRHGGSRSRRRRLWRRPDSQPARRDAPPSCSGKEAALFVPTGTMGNTIAIKLHTEHGQEVICESRSHILNYELAMMAWFAGCVARPIADARRDSDLGADRTRDSSRSGRTGRPPD